MGQFIWFYPYNSADAISVSANPIGFTTQNRVGDYLGYSIDEMLSSANLCNERDDIFLLDKKKPYLMLVPKTRGQRNVSLLIQKLILDCNQYEIKNLHFTHYGFVQKKLPELEVQQILGELELAQQKSRIESLIWDIDSRSADQFRAILSKFSFV